MRGVAEPRGVLSYLGEDFRPILAADPVEVAPALLGLVLVSGANSDGLTAGRIVEVEAYRGPDDDASHAFRGQSERNKTMFGPPGLLYVYFTYGMHHCCNVVCQPEGVAGAVLVRALEPLVGLDVMAARRSLQRAGAGDLAPARPERELCSGPGKLCQALGLDRRVDGSDLLASSARVRLAPADLGLGASADRLAPSTVAALPVSPDGRRVACGPRIGISASLTTADKAWRWWLADSAHVSRR